MYLCKTPVYGSTNSSKKQKLGHNARTKKGSCHSKYIIVNDTCRNYIQQRHTTTSGLYRECRNP